MTHISTKQIAIPALYMRGGTSKGVFFQSKDLPEDSASRDAILLRAIGSPDAYEKQIDGMGCATSSTSKVVIISKSNRPDCDVDYLFGQVSIDKAFIDWSGNCGNLTAAVGPFAIHRGLVVVQGENIATVRIWQANIGKRIIAHVPLQDCTVQETGDFILDGVPFPAAEIKLEFLDSGSPIFPTGNVIDKLLIPEVGTIHATLINAGNPAVFVTAESLGLTGTELQSEIDSNADLLARCELIRAHGAVAMGLAPDITHASQKRQHTPKLAFFAPPATYSASNGRIVSDSEIDILARIFSMGKLHHAMTGTGAVGIAAAAGVPGTILINILGEPTSCLKFGHPSGTLIVGAEAAYESVGWVVNKVVMSRSARRLMEGSVYVPSHA